MRIGPSRSIALADAGRQAGQRRLDALARAVQLRVEPQAVEVARQRADVRGDRHAVVVHDDHDRQVQAAGVEQRLERLGPILKESLKAYWAPGLFFEELDLAYVGVIDGHDVKALRRAIGEALEADRPVVVHCKTVKGKGFEPAEEGGLEGMEKWHAAKPGSISNGAAAEVPRRPSASPSSPGRRSTRRCSARRSSRSAAATTAWSASPPR